jgi:hypothetical protein
MLCGATPEWYLIYLTEWVLPDESRVSKRLSHGVVRDIPIPSDLLSHRKGAAVKHSHMAYRVSPTIPLVKKKTSHLEVDGQSLLNYMSRLKKKYKALGEEILSVYLGG